MLLGSFTPEGESELVHVAVSRSLVDEKSKSSYLVLDKVFAGSTAGADGWGTDFRELRAPGAMSRG